MATIPKVVVRHPFEASGAILVKWSKMGEGDVGEPFLCPNYADKSVQVEGTFGAGGNVQMQASNIIAEDPTFRPMHDVQNSEINIGLPQIVQLLENAYQVRPEVTAGDGTTELDVYLLIETVR